MTGINGEIIQEPREEEEDHLVHRVHRVEVANMINIAEKNQKGIVEETRDKEEIQSIKEGAILRAPLDSHRVLILRAVRLNRLNPKKIKKSQSSLIWE